MAFRSVPPLSGTILALKRRIHWWACRATAEWFSDRASIGLYALSILDSSLGRIPGLDRREAETASCFMHRLSVSKALHDVGSALREWLESQTDCLELLVNSMKIGSKSTPLQSDLHISLSPAQETTTE
jgi:hypothetical protein